MNPILPRVQIAKHHTQWHRLAIAVILPSLLTLAPFAMQAMAHAPENHARQRQTAAARSCYR